MAARDGDTALWLHNKLGSTDDLWSGSSICAQLTRDKLHNIQGCFHNLQPYVKVKLMLSLLHLPKRNVEEWKAELEEILQMAQDDTDQWVAMVGDLLKTYPSSGAINTDIDNQHRFCHEIVTDLKKIVKKSVDAGMIPLECLYLSRNAFMSVAGQASQPVKHFALKRKPKSAALRAELLQKSAEAANNLRKNQTTSSVPIKVRSFAKRMDDKSPMRGIPNNTPPSGGFLRSSALASRSFGGTPLGNRTPAGRKEGGIKLLDITDMPVGPKEAKRRRKQQEAEALEQQKKEKEAQANQTPDYAAGLVNPAIGALTSTVATVTVTGPSYVPTTTVTRIQGVAQGGTVTLPTNSISAATQQARENLQAQLQQQLVVTTPSVFSTNGTQSVITTTSVTLPQPTVAPQQPTVTPQPQQVQQVQQVQQRIVVGQPGSATIVATGQQQKQLPSSQPQQKKGLSLTREQMLEAQEMFRTSNKVTRPEKALILGFMAGSRENPCPQQGDIVNIRLSEHGESIQQPDGSFRPMMVDTYFQMNYKSGEWKRIKKYRNVEIDAD